MDSFHSLMALVPPPAAGKLLRLHDDSEKDLLFVEQAAQRTAKATPAAQSQCMDCRR